jgi:hypothetical protein
MKHKSAFMLGFTALVVIVLAAIAFAPIVKTYIANHLGVSKPPFTISPTMPPKTSTQLAGSSNAPTDGYGIYESCSPKDANTCLSHLNTMAAAGFKLVINYDQLDGDANFQKAYLDRAQSLGMKVIIPLSNPALYSGKDLSSIFPDLLKTCDCTDNQGFVAYVVNLVKQSPGLWGYYVGDEVDPSDHDQMKSNVADIVHQIDPNHPRLFIDNPGHSISAWHENSPFFDTADVIGSDFYPIRDTSPGYPTIDQTDQVASGIQAYADLHNESSAIVLQAFSYANYDIPGIPYPTADQMQYMLSQTLVNSHPRVVLWYSYYDTMSSGSASIEHWDTLKSIISASETKK